MNFKYQYILVIYGPTGVGKTDISLKIANAIPSQIINMDSGQFYTPLSIGTAKPNWQDQKIPHRLFDIINKPEDITVLKYRQLIMPLLHEIWQQGQVPVLVGGSGFYLKSLLFPPVDNSTYQESDFKEIPNNNNAWQQLHEIDPERAEHIHPHDIYRIERALAIWHKTGKKPSEFKPKYDPPCSYKIIMVERDRDDLYNRINQRVSEMLQAGWIEETKKLIGTDWEHFLEDKKIIGYKEIIDYLKDRSSREIMEQKIAQYTRNYAKRQVIFGAGLKKSIEKAQNDLNTSLIAQLNTVNLTHCDVNVYIKQLLHELQIMFN